ncbi:MAG: gliding motility-associated C-terminal domain-containing protein, partial [Bacteroidota bacterium]|nr:gliding motility-associated C-terminal domain-containing protein [Bacteroidota bacterium]
TLKESPNEIMCNFSTNANIKFTTELSDTLDICTGSDLAGTWGATGNWGKLQGLDPSNGAWRVELTDNQSWSGSDGILVSAAISFIDENWDGDTVTVAYSSDTINKAILDYDGSGPFASTEYIVPMGLQTSCFGLCDATAIINTEGGTNPIVSYEWSNTVDFSSTFSTNDTVDLCAGTYYIRVIDALGCSDIDSVTVIEPPEIIITNDSVVNNTCYGDTSGIIMLEFTGGTPPLTYSIGGDFKPSGFVFENLAADTYNVTIIDISGCTKDTSITITEPTEITYNTDVTPITCYGSDNGEIQILDTLGGIQPYTFSIDSGATYLSNNGSFTSLSPDTFYVAVMDANGCEQFGDTIYMLQPDTITIDSVKVTPTTCVGGGNDGTIVIWASGGTGELSYSINGGTDFFTDSLFTNLTETDYNIIVEDKNGCSKTLDSILTVSSPPEIIIDSLHLTNIEDCYGDNTGQIVVFASGGSGDLEYSLNATDYQASSTFNSINANTYTITVRDEGMCTKATTITLTQPDEIIISSLDIINITNCTEADSVGSININALGGTGNLEYSINGGTSFETNSLFEDLYAGDYTIVVRDENLCTTTIDTAITETQALTANIIIDSITCNGLANAQITITPQYGLAPYTYVWEHDGFLTDSIAENLSPGWYKFTVYDSNLPSSCEYIDSVEITEPEAILVSNINITDAYCEKNHSRTGTDIGSINIDVSRGTEPLSYLWSNGDETKDLTDVTGGEYTLTVTDNNDCENTITETISFDENYKIKAIVSNDKDTCCFKENIVLTATTQGADSITWQWYEGAYVKNAKYLVTNSIMDTSFITNEETLYTLIAINSKCKDTDSRRIFMHPYLGLSVIDNDDNDDDGKKYVLEGKCCSSLEAQIDNDTIEATYQWYPSENLETPTNLTTGLTVTQSQFYKIIATTEFGCEESDSIYVELVPKTKPYSGFSPNGDENNDYWHIENADQYPNIVVIVYNRWGNLIFEQKGYENNDPNKRWDGTSTNNKDMPSGTYYFIIDVKEKDMKPITGSVTIVR